MFRMASAAPAAPTVSWPSTPASMHTRSSWARASWPPARMEAKTNRLPRTAAAGVRPTLTRMPGALVSTTGAMAASRPGSLS